MIEMIGVNGVTGKIEMIGVIGITGMIVIMGSIQSDWGYWDDG